MARWAVWFPPMPTRQAAYDDLYPTVQAGGGAGQSADGVSERLTSAFRGAGNIAATIREADAAPGEPAGAVRDWVAEGCSGDVSCAAGSSGRGPQAAVLSCRGGPAAMRGRAGLRPAAVGCGHAR